MNDHPNNEASDYCEPFDASVRENPTRAIVIALGVGIALGLAIRALQPPPPATRAARLIEDLQDRLHGLSDRAASMAGSGVDRVRDLGLDRGVRSLSQRIQNLFH